MFMDHGSLTRCMGLSQSTGHRTGQTNEMCYKEMGAWWLFKLGMSFPVKNGGSLAIDGSFYFCSPSNPIFTNSHLAYDNGSDRIASDTLLRDRHPEEGTCAIQGRSFFILVYVNGHILEEKELRGGERRKRREET